MIKRGIWIGPVNSLGHLSSCFTFFCIVTYHLQERYRDEPQTKLSIFTPNSLLQADEAGDFDVNANLMDLRPDPTAFAAYIKSINRPDIASEIFVRLLEAYQLSKSLADDDPLQ
jgi:hypothetical protein